ncbi:hypothetical protein LTR62_003980 [Meristemomyces frigidus]|uniref:Uncharacterized protein n=1 Tax=Meristemomyces frigidus TaxID=1508187 RepID=A0AAN7YJH1_9PEZI|nr:hypothetical protein LTR62_003980 [Meristemomyces frigidus]
MATSSPQGLATYAGMKRNRDSNNEPEYHGPGLHNKKIRPTIDPTEEDHQFDSVLSTPTTVARPKYDSDDQSSMVSEPGSPQDYAASHSSDDDMDMEVDDMTFSQPPGSSQSNSPWRERIRSSPRNRVATPFGLATATRPAITQPRVRTRTSGSKNHIRSRHPQENAHASDHLEVPSPIEETEAHTPPFIGSELSNLSVSDMDIEPAAHLPSITIAPARNDSVSPGIEQMMRRDAAGTAAVTTMEMDEPSIPMLRKQRQRSGAQSHGSASPVRGMAGGMDREMEGMMGGKRGLSMGFRADCEKCRMRVPGHMNHFVA